MAQLNPDGLKLVFLLAEEFLEGASSALVLENNIFFGHGQSKLSATGDVYHTGGMVFGYRVTFTERYSVVAFDAEGKTREIIKISDFAFELRGHWSLFLGRDRTRVGAEFQALTAGLIGDRGPLADASGGGTVACRDYRAQFCLA